MAAPTASSSSVFSYSPPSASEVARDALRISPCRRCNGVSPTDLGYEWACWKRTLLRQPHPEDYNLRPTRRDERDFASHVYPMVRGLTDKRGGAVMVVNSFPRLSSAGQRVLFDAHAESRRLVRIHMDIAEFRVIFDPPDSQARAFRFVYKTREDPTERSGSNWQFVLPLGNFVAYSGTASSSTSMEQIHTIPARLYTNIGVSASYSQAFSLYITEFWEAWVGFLDPEVLSSSSTMYSSFHSKEHALTGEGKTNDDDDEDDDDDDEHRDANGDYVIAVPAATDEDEKVVHICGAFLSRNDFKRLEGMKDRGEGEDENPLMCCICYGDTTEETHFLLTCGHFVCKVCSVKITACPICRKSIAGRGTKRKRGE